MKPDPDKSQELQNWPAKALKDFRIAGLLLDSPDTTLFEDVLFHAQQAAEKTLKAFLLHSNVTFRKTHDLSELSRQCIGVVPELQTPLETIAYLTPFAAVKRYPLIEPPQPPSHEYATDAIRQARAVYFAVLELLPPETRPDKAPPEF